MNSKLIEETASGLEMIFKATMELYENYFKALEAAIQITPNSEVGKLTELNALAKEGQEALEADLAIFDKAVSTDAEGLVEVQDKLKMQSIYNKLKK